LGEIWSEILDILRLDRWSGGGQAPGKKVEKKEKVSVL